MVIMKKIILTLICLFSLTACDKTSEGFYVYRDCLDNLNNHSSYSIYEVCDDHISLQEFAPNMSHLENDEMDVYFFFEGDEFKAISYVPSKNIFIKEETDYDEHYMYAYQVIERFSKIKAFVDNGDLKYTKNKFKASRMHGTYLYNGELHTPTKMLIEIEDNKIVYFKEEYKVNGKTKVDEMYISNYGTNNIELPKNVIEPDYFEEMLSE